MTNAAFEAAVQIFGSQKRFAEATGLSSKMTNHILRGRRKLPESWAPIIEEKTSGRVKAKDLCPDSTWLLLSNQKAK